MEEKWKGTEDYREKGEERVREGKGREWKGRDSPFLQTYFAFLQASGRMCPWLNNTKQTREALDRGA